MLRELFQNSCFHQVRDFELRIKQVNTNVLIDMMKLFLVRKYLFFWNIYKSSVWCQRFATVGSFLTLCFAVSRQQNVFFLGSLTSKKGKMTGWRRKGCLQLL